MWIELSRFTCKTLEKVSDTMRNQLSFPLPGRPIVSLPGLVTLAISLAVPCSALAPVQGQAWTGERVVRVFDVQTTAVRHATQESVFVRGDGSVAVHRALASPAGQARFIRQIFDLSTKKRVVADDATQSTTTYTLGAGETAEPLAQSPGCAESTPSGNLLNFSVHYRSVELPGPNGMRFRRETWSAPSLGCAALRSRSWLKRSSGDWVLTMETEYRTVTLQTPPQAAFAAPQGYTERSPGEVLALARQRNTGAAAQCSECEEDTARKLNEVYATRRP
jgi:hypothetical protein